MKASLGTVVLILSVLLVACQRAPGIPVTFTGPNEMDEGATKNLTCTATTNQNLRRLSVTQTLGTGNFAADSDPNPKVAVHAYTPTPAGKSRNASFTCSARDVNGLSGGGLLQFITRDKQDPTWNGPIPSLPPAGADGNPPGKVGVNFDVRIDAKDNGGAGVRGRESGIHVLSLTRTLGSITVTNPVWTDRFVVPPGQPGGTSGKLNRAHTFTAQCTAPGGAILGTSAVDAAGNEILLSLRLECYN